MHVARVSQCFKFLADTRDPTVRQVALLQLDEVVRKRMRVPRYTPISIEDLSSFLNTLAASKEGARGDIKSLWSSARASLSHTHSAIHISSDSAVVHCEGKEVRWAKRHEVNQILKQATQSRHLASLQEPLTRVVQHTPPLSQIHPTSLSTWVRSYPSRNTASP